MIESNDQEWGLCDHFPLALEIDDDDAEADYGDAWDEFDEQDDDDDEWPMAHMARVAADIEAGRAEVSPGWRLDRPVPGVLVWTAPSGVCFATTLTGEKIPVPGT